MHENASNWVLHERVRRHLNVNRRTLRALMDKTPDGVPRPWVDIGLRRSPRYRWESLEAASAWLRAVGHVER